MSAFFSPEFSETFLPAASADFKAREREFHLLATSVLNYAMLLVDAEGRIVIWSEGARRLFGYDEAEIVGQPVALIFTDEDRTSGFPEREFAAVARDGRVADPRWYVKKDGSRFWADGVTERIVGKETDDGAPFRGFAKVLRDATQAKIEQDAFNEAREQVRARDEYMRSVLASTKDCIKTLDLNGNLVAMTDTGQEVMEVDDFSTICGLDWLTFWQDDTQADVRAAIDAAKAGGTGRFQGFCTTLKGTPKWWDVIVSPILGADGQPQQLLGISRDITEQKNADARERARLAELFMQAPAFMAALRGPNHIYELVNPLYLQLIGRQGGENIIGKSIADVLPEVVAQGFIDLLDRAYQTGETIVGSNARVELRKVTNGPLEECFVDFTFQPLRDSDGAVSGLLVHGVDLTERNRLEREQERMLADARARAQWEALLHQIGESVRETLDPEAILQRAVTLLGQGLQADRCYFVRDDQARDTAWVGPEWLRAGVEIKTLIGIAFKTSAYSVARDEAYSAGRTHVVNDVVAYDPEDAEPLLALPIRSLLRVPIDTGDQLTALSVAMAFEPRIWTRDEVRLVENVAALLRSTLESVRVQIRERNIAQQLQAALQPPPPDDLQGLALEGYYRPALAEAGVGGDFYDVFALDKGCTALVVGDLSGKGLAAASEVATVRNMVRYALYSSDTVAGAATGVNRVLAERKLLRGFSTLFVCVYDAVARSLTYVNCGQEPGLIWRKADGKVEYLPPTGSVLGGFESDEKYEEQTVLLASGDVFALFTDGLTEVGPNRREQLDVEGVGSIFGSCCTGDRREAKVILDCLIAGVDGFARGGVRDDIALLVGVAQ